MCMYPGFLPVSRVGGLQVVPPYQPQMPATEMTSLIHGNQPWKSHYEVMADVRDEQARIRAYNGAPGR